MKRAPAHSDRAFVLRTSPYGESDVVVTLLGEQEGVVPALARRARSPSPRKNALVLEPFHTLVVELASGSGELSSLRSAAIDVPRAALLDDARLEVAGLATRWVRTLCPPRTPEPEVFVALEALLDRLAAGTNGERALATFGLQLLDALGYGLELAACARCSRARPAGKAAYVTATGGGVVCESCRASTSPGEGLLEGALLDALVGDPASALDATDEQAARLLRVVRDAVELRARAVGSRTGAR